MIRVRLLIGFVLVALLPVIGVGIGTYIVGYQNGRQQSIDRLESVAARKELALQVWIQSLQLELQVASKGDYAPKLTSNALALSNENISYTWYNDLVRKRLQYFVDQSPQITELFLVDLKGRVIVSTVPTRERNSYADFIFDVHDLTIAHTQLPFRWDLSLSPQPAQEMVSDPSSVFVLIPVIKDDGHFVGAIGGKVGVDALHAILNETTGLGETGRAYLVNWDHTLLVGTDWRADDSESAEDLHIVRAGGIDRAIEESANFDGVYSNPAGETVIGIYRWLPDLNVVLAVEQDSAEAFQAVSANTTINLVIALIALVLAVFAALYMTQNIANPITDLADTASRIACGDLKPIANVAREDEVGALARAFNSMTSQLRDLINSLEQRVQERTHDFQEANAALEQRALQLETSAQVGREITSILEIDVLLNRVVELIQGAFGYYHVQVLLLDKDARQFVIGAGSGNRNVQHRYISLKEKSINVEAATTGRVQLVNDAQKDPNFLFDDRLPKTRSELVVPLKVGERVIGTLDVHDSRLNAFATEDALVIQSLGDQIAVAIENARLYDQSRKLAVLEERNRLSRELHDSVTQSLYSLVLFTEGWRRTVKSEGSEKIEEYLNRIGEIAQQSLKEMRLLILELRPPMLEQEGLVGALKKRLDAVEKRVGINARVVMDDFIELPAFLEKELYRIAQEALNNSLKHAKATKVTVRFYVEDQNIALEVVDDGMGFDPEAVGHRGGMGLLNMRERAKNLGGSLTIHSTPGKGTIVRVNAPTAETMVEPS
ncbi:MAG: histidine kinase [Anaerolineales bacterium]|nr:MAG: histidine kinase [Anaerolineales bacterium]